MHTQLQSELQGGAEICATAKLEKKSKDTNNTGESDICCPRALRVVVQDGTGEGGGDGEPRIDRLIQELGPFKKKSSEKLYLSPTEIHQIHQTIDRLGADRTAP